MVFWRKLHCMTAGKAITSIFILTLCSLLNVSSLAQIGSPFDLAPRLDTSRVFIPPAQLPPSRIPANQQVRTNPFDLQRASSAIAQDPIEPQRQLPTLPDSPQQTAGMSRATFDTLLTGVLFALLALALVLQGGSLTRMYAAAFNSNLLNRLMREQRKTGYYVWAVLGSISLGVFGFMAARQLYSNLLVYSWTTLDWFVLGVLGAVASKLVVLNLIRLIFPLDKPVRIYQTLILVYAGLIGVALFPAIVLIGFAPQSVASAVAWIGILFIGATYLLRNLRALAEATNYLLAYPFHFLLYLCGLEIGPLAVALKLLTT